MDSIRREVDRCKAFDTLNRSTLLTKLPAYGIVSTELELFTDYLFQRQQVVYSGSCTSDARPLLFTIFYNDFIDSVRESQVLMYADDSVIYTAGKSVELIEINCFFDSLKLH